MKEATGELSTTVIAVVAIAAIAAIFTVVLLPTLRASILRRTYCASADCTSECGSNNMMDCTYYTEGEDGQINVPHEIDCPCEDTTAD